MTSQRKNRAQKPFSSTKIPPTARSDLFPFSPFFFPVSLRSLSVGLHGFLSLKTIKCISTNYESRTSQPVDPHTHTHFLTQSLLHTHHRLSSLYESIRVGCLSHNTSFECVLRRFCGFLFFIFWNEWMQKHQMKLTPNFHSPPIWSAAAPLSPTLKRHFVKLQHNFEK